MDARTQAFLDQHRQQQIDSIRRKGWFIQYVFGSTCTRDTCDCQRDEAPAFAYTVGLFGLGHPELLVFGLDSATASALLNDLGERVRAGESFLPNQLIEFENWKHHVMLEEVPNPGDIVFQANDFYQRPDEASVPVLQVTYDDPNNRFPWDDDYMAPELQPRPGSFEA